MKSKDISDILEQRKIRSATVLWQNLPQTIIYGAGNLGKEVYKTLKNHGIPITCFFDRTASAGDSWSNVPIFRIEDSIIEPSERRKVVVIIAIHNWSAEIPPIIEKLNAFGFTRIMTLVELYDHFGKELGQRYWLTSRSYYGTIESEVSAGLSIWADNESRAIYEAMLNFRLTGDYKSLPPPETQHQYFPLDIPQWNTPLRFVDCGAFNGDTLGYILSNNIAVEAVAAFEPDRENFRQLAKSIMHGNWTNVALWPCAVYSETTQLRFQSENGMASSLRHEGESLVQCVSLDEAIPVFKPSLIKMDIEGAEIDALLGARQVIEKYRPGLAICVYHHPAHLWQIPLLIQKWECGYRFYLRSHAFNGFELVMYAVAD